MNTLEDLRKSFAEFQADSRTKMKAFKDNNGEKIKVTTAYADEVFEKHNLQDWIFDFTPLLGDSYDIDYEEKTLLFDCGICGELNIAGINSSIEYYMEEIVAHLKAIATTDKIKIIESNEDNPNDYNDYSNLPF